MTEHFHTAQIQSLPVDCHSGSCHNRITPLLTYIYRHTVGTVKVYDPDDEKGLGDTVKAALKQIEDKNYRSALMAEGISEERIREYGFGFEGKKVLIG